MKQNFDVKKLEAFLKDYYTVTEIRITVFDENFNEITAYPPKRAELCETLRKNAALDKKCRECDMAACRFASKSNEPYVYKCHIGLTEIISPLSLNGKLFGYLFFAHVFSFDNLDSGVKEISANAKGYGFDENTVRTLCAKMPIKSNDFIGASANLLSAVATYLCMQKSSLSKKTELATDIEEYIVAHLDRDLSAESLSKTFGIGRTKLYSILNDRFGESLAAYVKRLRLEKAKQLLSEDADAKISDVAEKCGFLDYNYFIANFRRYFGVSPKKYAKKHSGK